ncbi:HAD hydrolase family protein [Nocardioides sp. B-3]|uniref:HAD hydrolase family protein n=1 Tax=Nocardioides sp. B-3 TaxID=2895565 RepID=UPI002152163E|nr:HAD hydrolase family protein [Nocardioides sp. B-3]UUZ59251.1 HAD hydrolase family protein [Nocardioides sp. B-3]
MDKRDFALSFCREFGADPADCVAIGDSRSDLPLFRSVGYSIAFNASSEARATATVAVDSNSMTDAIPWLDSWLGVASDGAASTVDEVDSAHG